MRIQDHPVLGPLPPTPTVTFTFDGVPVQALEGECLAAALWASGIRILRHSFSGRQPRGMYCGVGHCYECRVTVNGVRDRRACLTPVVAGMDVRSQPPDLLEEARPAVGGPVAEGRKPEAAGGADGS